MSGMKMKLQMRLERASQIPVDGHRFAECAGCHAFHQLVRHVSEESPDGYIYIQPTHTCADGYIAEAPR